MRSSGRLLAEESFIFRLNEISFQPPGVVIPICFLVACQLKRIFFQLPRRCSGRLFAEENQFQPRSPVSAPAVVGESSGRKPSCTPAPPENLDGKGGGKGGEVFRFEARLGSVLMSEFRACLA